MGLAFISLPLVKDLLNISINMHQHFFFAISRYRDWLDFVGMGWILLDFVVVLPTTNIVGRWFLIDASDSLYSLYVTIDCGGRLVRSAKPWGNTTRLHRHTLMVVAANGLCSIGSL